MSAKATTTKIMTPEKIAAKAAKDQARQEAKAAKVQAREEAKAAKAEARKQAKIDSDAQKELAKAAKIAAKRIPAIHGWNSVFVRTIKTISGLFVSSA